MGDGHFSAAEENWCGQISADIIGKFSADYL